MTRLVTDQQSGKIEGRTVLTLALSTITINGRPVDVTSTDVKTESSSRGKRSAGVIGGTAALGAIIGANCGRRQGSGHRRGIGSGGGHRRGSPDQRTEGQDSLGNQTDVPAAEPRSAMRLAAAALVLTLAAGHCAFAGRNDVVEGNPASPVKVLIYDDLQCSDCARFRVSARREDSPKVRIEGRVCSSRFPAGKARLGAPRGDRGALGLRAE